ncbi:cupin-like domain-containing protein [Pseudoduganella eburnea]|uniref:Cupin-like domain-containing protein n=1 Tax=Massilia eburnea TaxID=1776165 RepID=A0A6L6QCC3_9BURK|nr:cupin-like domain-containing protein [Massilia eburnea]MTW09437.1 cupin-like domain-containing protein [Massilia eburnea]
MLANAKPIRELHGLTPSDLNDDLLTATEPLVLRGLVARWPAVQASRAGAASADAYLRRFYRDASVVAMLGTREIGGRFFYNQDLSGFNFASVRARLDDVLDELAGQRDNPVPPAIYVGSTTVDTALPGYREENPLDLGPRDALMSVWIGNQTRIAAHYDLPDNLACVTAGRRRFTLFPPDQLENLYVGPLDFTPAGQPISLVDLHQPDLDRFPRFAEAMRHALCAELEPGDAIFIPSMWWHHVEALENFNVLVNYWWRQSPEYMDTPTNALMLSLLSIRDLPREQRRAWQELFRHYVFEAGGATAAHIPVQAQRVLGPISDDAARMLRAQLLKKINR